jgi:Fur family iron response transcriptional regulator
MSIPAPSPRQASEKFAMPAPRPDSDGCPVARLRQRLRDAGLRPTRQRMLLGWLLFGKGERHVSAELLFQEVNRVRASLSLATVYNTLNQFRDAGLLRQVNAGGTRAIYDTDTGDHHHFVVERDGTILDLPASAVTIGSLPDAPKGYRVVGVDVVVRLERTDCPLPPLPPLPEAAE